MLIGPKPQLEAESRVRYEEWKNMEYQKIESHDEYLKIVEQYQDYEAGTCESMSLKEKSLFGFVSPASIFKRPRHE